MPVHVSTLFDHTVLAIVDSSTDEFGGRIFADDYIFVVSAGDR